MSDEKPALVRIQRATPAHNFTAVFALAGPAGEVSVELPSGIAEEHMLAVARDHLHRLMQATASATKDWGLPEDRRREIDPSAKPRTGFGFRPNRGSDFP